MAGRVGQIVVGGLGRGDKEMEGILRQGWARVLMLGALYFHVESKRSLRPTRALICPFTPESGGNGGPQDGARSLDGHRDDDAWD
jgi:hypothetical protein